MDSRSDENKTNKPKLVTLHLTNLKPKKTCGFSFSTTKIYQPQELIKELYNNFLKDDPLFHFFYEPDLIIRISSTDVLEKIKNNLTQKRLDYIVYDYPTPTQHHDRYCYGESQGGPVMERLYDLYLPLFHLNAIAALTMLPEEHNIYMERANHTMCNMAGDSRHSEAEKLVRLGELKAERPLQFSNAMP